MLHKAFASSQSSEQTAPCCLAGKLPPVGEVLRGHGVPELPAGHPAVRYDARLRPPEVGGSMTGRLSCPHHAGSFLARQRWRTAESRRLGAPDVKASTMPTRTRRPKPCRSLTSTTRTAGPV